MPAVHFMHGVTYAYGGLISISGISFERWLDENFDTLPEVYLADISQVIIEGNNIESKNITQEYHRGTNLLLIDVRWSDGGPEFSLHRYVLAIV